MTAHILVHTLDSVNLHLKNNQIQLAREIIKDYMDKPDSIPVSFITINKNDCPELHAFMLVRQFACE